MREGRMAPIGGLAPEEGDLDGERPALSHKLVMVADPSGEWCSRGERSARSGSPGLIAIVPSNSVRAFKVEIMYLNGTCENNDIAPSATC